MAKTAQMGFTEADVYFDVEDETETSRVSGYVFDEEVI